MANLSSVFDYRVSHVVNNKKWVMDIASRQLVANVLDIPTDDLSQPDTWRWNIVDADADIFLVSFNPKLVKGSDLKRLGWLKGTAVHKRRRCRVITGQGYVPGAVIDALELDDSQQVNIVDNFGRKHGFDLTKTMITPMFEGTILNISKIDNKVYYSTGNTLHAENSFYNGSARYVDAYNKLGGPAEQLLFDPNVTDSPYTHVFILVLPELLSCTKLDVGSGFLVYVGANQNWDQHQAPSYVKYETKPWFDFQSPLLSHDIDELDDKPFIYAINNMTIEQANKFLRFGFMDPFDIKGYDQRLLPGEALILQDFTNPKQPKTIRIYSSSYAWRRSIRGEEPSIRATFYHLADDRNLPISLFERKYPKLAEIDIDTAADVINNGDYLQLWPLSSQNMPITDSMQRLEVIWMALLSACYVGHQCKVIGVFDQFIADLDYISTKLLCSNQQVLAPGQKYPKNIMTIIKNNKNDEKLMYTNVYITMPGSEIHRISKFLRQQEYFIQKSANASIIAVDA